MSCQHYLGEINAWVDGTLDRVERREIEDHLAACEACRALAADLQRVRELGGRLERMTPPPALWERISGEIGREPRKKPVLRRVVWMPLAAAAVLALAIGFTAWRQQPSAPAARPDQTAVDLANSVEEELRLAAQHYENAIAGLERLARDRQQLLDPQVAATLHRNLQVIDTAISESRTALQEQPTNDSAQQSLFDAFRTKIALLEDTIALLNELRQSGQPAQTGAAAGGSSL
jgi:anti-sigma factor RsiW